jgi:hydrogenase maturation protease
VPELAEPISEAGLVVFVDATMGETPGEVKVFTLEAAPPRRGSHQTTPEGLMTLAAELFDRRPAAFMVTISGESFELSEVLSLPVGLAIPRAVREIITLIQEKTAGPAE